MDTLTVTEWVLLPFTLLGVWVVTNLVLDFARFLFIRGLRVWWRFR